ncbi:MAG: protein-methionine-sulfoxide reductase catalytic subunit MsrP, partial [Candidatus Entotheonellia bacterium]
MLIRRAPDFRSSEITDYQVYLNRRSFMLGLATMALAPSGLSTALAAPSGQPLQATRNAAFAVED